MGVGYRAGCEPALHHAEFEGELSVACVSIAVRLLETFEYGREGAQHACKLWLVGANRSGTFGSGMVVSDDAKTWRRQDAPWSPRGGVAVWTNGADLFVTGGKYSYEKNGETIFVYSNDVWRMRRN